MIVCADDFGLTDDINRAVIDLVKHGRISAVSCMVALEYFNRDAFARLLRFGDRIDVGLHLTLTDIRPIHVVSGIKTLVQPSGHFYPLGSLFRKSLRRGIRSADVMREVQSQMDRFRELAGRWPDFLDSHLHVHQFPGIGKGVLRYLEGLEVDETPYVRNSAMSPRKISSQRVSPLKCHAIGRFGQGFLRAVEKRKLKTNHGFGGIYAYNHSYWFPLYLRRFVECMESENGIVMTHPGELEPWRKMEYQTLLKADYLTGRINRFLNA